jgi:HK97 family phage major capsid protein
MGTMTIAEARSEIKNLFDQAEVIERKYDDPEKMPNEEREELKSLLGNIDGLEAKLSTLEDADDRRKRIMEGIERYGVPAGQSYRPNVQADDIKAAKTVSPGEQFIKSMDYKNLRLNGAFKSQLNQTPFNVTLLEGTSLIEWKALLRGGSASSGGAFVREDLRPGYMELLQREIQILDLIPRLQTNADTIEYVREDTFTNNAAFVAEATATTGTSGLKPESVLEYSRQTAAVKTLAHWIPVTNRMLDDAPAIAGIINGRLLLGLDLILETQVLSGNGSGENFTGITATPGVNIQGKGADNELDAIFKARTQIRVNGKGRPSAVVLHPNDWQVIRLTRENATTGTLGQYLMGPPSQIGAVTVWGIPVVESEAIAENTGVIGDWAMGASLFDREQAAIRVGTINDQMIRNMQTILAELRAAFVVWRPSMFTRITGI